MITTGKKRVEAYKKLEVFLKNPGRFCLMVLGDRGTGKHYAIESTFKKVKTQDNDELCLSSINFIKAKEVPSVKEEIDDLLSKYDFSVLVIEDVEDLNKEQELLLFEALSTIDGTFGINEKKYKIRMVFTSSINSVFLREDGKYLTGIFWDRISQLIVELPSYKIEPDNIVPDFKATWIKMKFEEIKGYEHLALTPNYYLLESTLEDNAEKIEGGFRDLDKFACMYFNYRIFHYGDKKRIVDSIEKLVVESVKSDFFSKSQLQSHSGNESSIFKFETGFNHRELLAKYKIQLRDWAFLEYGSIGKAELKLGFKKGTLKNYVPGKVTQREREVKNENQD